MNNNDNLHHAQVKLMEARRHFNTDPTDRGCLRAALFTLSAARKLSTKATLSPQPLPPLSLLPRFESLQEQIMRLAQHGGDDPKPIPPAKLEPAQSMLDYAHATLIHHMDYDKTYSREPPPSPLVHALLRATVSLVASASNAAAENSSVVSIADLRLFHRSVRKAMDLLRLHGIDE